MKRSADSWEFCQTELADIHQLMGSVYFEYYIYLSCPNDFDSRALIMHPRHIQGTGLK